MHVLTSYNLRHTAGAQVYDIFRGFGGTFIFVVVPQDVQSDYDLFALISGLERMEKGYKATVRVSLDMVTKFEERVAAKGFSCNCTGSTGSP